MVAVMIGVDPHKGSHTAVAIGAAEEPLGELRVRACGAQAERLLAWAAEWPERTWAVEGAAGLGHLLAQQLLAAGERVLDVQPKLGARVRLLAAGAVNKNDPNDARSVAVAFANVSTISLGMSVTGRPGQPLRRPACTLDAPLVTVNPPVPLTHRAQSGHGRPTHYKRAPGALHGSKPGLTLRLAVSWRWRLLLLTAARGHLGGTLDGRAICCSGGRMGTLPCLPRSSSVVMSGCPTRRGRMQSKASSGRWLWSIVDP